MSKLYSLLIIFIATFALFSFAACNRHSNKNSPILLFNGTGTSPNDVTAIETILDNNHLDYATANSAEINNISESELLKHKLLIIPGGDFVVMGKGLTPAASIKIQHAVQNGLSYLGVCAGAFLAGKSGYYNGFNITSGVTFGFYAAVNTAVSKMPVAINSPDAPALDQYWENGPQLSGWGKVVAKYPDGTPAVAQGKCDNGFVILSGIHAEAPEDWRGDLIFNTPASADNAYFVKLVNAALKGTQLPHY